MVRIILLAALALASVFAFQTSKGAESGDETAKRVAAELERILQAGYAKTGFADNATVSLQGCVLSFVVHYDRRCVPGLAGGILEQQTKLDLRDTFNGEGWVTVYPYEDGKDLLMILMSEAYMSSPSRSASSMSFAVCGKPDSTPTIPGALSFPFAADQVQEIRVRLKSYRETFCS